ncbi:MAG: tRNA dihydrouridine synthase DusB [Mucinivorans sp.]
MDKFFQNLIKPTPENENRVPLLLAPMEDVTDSSFRRLCKEFGADVVYTEFVSSDALVRDAEKSLKKLDFQADERPIGIQIYGNITQAMVDSALIAQSYDPELIDINFGCPVRKIAGRGAGSGMMRTPEKMVEITSEVVKNVKKPVTVKTRLGWDDDSKNIEDIALALQDVGIAALTIHGRTRAQMYKGEADWELIGKIKNNPAIKIPIIGNGDIDSPEKAKMYLDRYGVDGLMIGRATYGRPWIFSEVSHYLLTGEKLAQPSVEQRVEIAKRHLLLSIELKGEKVGILEMRRHLSCYFKGFKDFKPLRMRLVTTGELVPLMAVFDDILDLYSGYDSTGITPENPWV